MADDETGSDWEFETRDVEAGDSDDESDDESADDGEWRYSLSDLADDETAEEQSAVGGNVFGSLSGDSEVVEAGSPTMENTLFVVVGAVLALVVFLQFYLLIG